MSLLQERTEPRAPLVSVLTPVLDEESHLPAVLASMQAQEVTGGVEFLFVDGGSRDGSRRLLEGCAAQDPRVLVLDNPSRRTPQALNIALARARGEFVARMDAHTHYPPDYLQRGVERLRRGDVVSVSGPQLARGEGRWSRRVALALATPLGVGSAAFRRAQSRERDVESGFTGLWRREVLLEHGGWDERWLNDQDTELAARLRAAGGRIVCVPEMAADYVPRDSLRALGRQYWRYGWYRVLTSHRHPGTLRRAQVLPAAVVLTAIGCLLPRPAGRVSRAGLAGYLAALLLTAARAVATAPRGDAVALPAVHATMHAAYGAGFLAACLRHGVPWPAVRGLVRGARG